MNLVSLIVLISMVVVIIWLVLVVGEFSVVILYVMFFGVDFGFDFGGCWYNVVFGLVVLLLVFWVLYYVFFYMGFFVGLVWFNVFMLVFILSMLVVVVGKLFWILWLGWEGLGVFSFLLIMFYNNWKCNSFVMMMIMMNCVGDFVLMVMVVILGCGFVFNYEYVVYGFLSLVMFLGVMVVKSV